MLELEVIMYPNGERMTLNGDFHFLERCISVGCTILSVKGV